MTGREWISEFAERLGIEPPDDQTIATLLALAGSAAHASERTAAPIACYLVGRAGADPKTAQQLAEKIGTALA